MSLQSTLGHSQSSFSSSCQSNLDCALYNDNFAGHSASSLNNLVCVWPYIPSREIEIIRLVVSIDNHRPHHHNPALSTSFNNSKNHEYTHNNNNVIDKVVNNSKRNNPYNLDPHHHHPTHLRHVLYIGDPETLFHQVHVGCILPNYSFLPVYIPYVFEQFLRLVKRRGGWVGGCGW